ncbi:unnamed protein product [Bursaphelenchus okinawaensis]|uniref:Uncharacterized protein n=1 Tax=Bursaphelenchus okinawaensis TaxID=465554 RepID=A0A811LMN4_9BILA|nr:unnamed protein product [Bursaphelenchus okinawaensis]CAG9128157.1 unnamed protein product [Bursaphelenchus okinawaensis]
MSEKTIFDIFFVLKGEHGEYVMVKNTDAKFLGCLLNVQQRADVDLHSKIKILEIDGVKIYQVVYKSTDPLACLAEIEKLRNIIDDPTKAMIRNYLQKYHGEVNQMLDATMTVLADVQIASAMMKNMGENGNNKNNVQPKKTKKTFEEHMRGKFKL